MDGSVTLHSVCKALLYVFLYNLVLRGGIRMFEWEGAENIKRGTSCMWWGTGTQRVGMN